MTNSFEYRCRSCGEIHVGLPAWHFAASRQALAVPSGERKARVELTEDGCVIDEREFYIKGLLDIPIHDVEEFLHGVSGYHLSKGNLNAIAKFLRTNSGDPENHSADRYATAFPIILKLIPFLRN